MEKIVSNRTGKDLNRFISHLPLDSTDNVTVVLKGHLLVEELLKEYVSLQFKKPEMLKDARLTFHQILCIARASSNDASSEKLWLSIEKLNGLRNKLAHSLEPKDLEIKIEEFVSHLSNFNPREDYVSQDLKFGVLTSCILGLCLSLSALLEK
jgi:hypothetical protein